MWAPVSCDTVSNIGPVELLILMLLVVVVVGALAVRLIRRR